MLPYGLVKTKYGKDGTHRDCPICDPSTGNKKKARQENKRSIINELNLLVNFKLRTKMTLADCAPYEFSEGEFSDIQAFKFKDVEVVKCHGYGETSSAPWIGTHKNVINWCELENGYAIGWNENPSTGWMFPVKKLTVK